MAKSKAPIRLEFVLANNKLTVTNGLDQLLSGFEKSAQKGARMMVKHFEDGIKQIAGSIKALERTGLFSMMGGKAGSGSSLGKVQGQVQGAIKAISVLGEAAAIVRRQLQAADRAATLGRSAKTPQGIPIKFDDAMLAKITKAFSTMGSGPGSGGGLTKTNQLLEKILTTLQAGLKYNPASGGKGKRKGGKPYDYTGEPDLSHFFGEGETDTYGRGSKGRTETLRDFFGGSASVQYKFNRKTGAYDRNRVQVRAVDSAFVGALDSSIKSFIGGRGISSPYQTTTSGINAKGIRTVIESYVDLQTKEVLKRKLGYDSAGNLVSSSMQISPVSRTQSPVNFVPPAYSGPKSSRLPDPAKDPFFQARMQAEGRALAQSLGLSLVGSITNKRPGRPDELLETFEKKSGIFSQGSRITVSSLKGFRQETLQSLSAWEKLVKAWQVGSKVWHATGKAIDVGMTVMTLGLNKLLTSPRLASFFYILSRIRYGLETAIINPMRTLERGIRETTERFREFEISISGTVGGSDRARAIHGLIAKSAITGGLPLTLEGLQDSARQQSFIASEAPKLARGSVQDVQRQIEEFAKLTTKLSIIDPEQGVKGAGIAVREFLAGESRSLRFRFEISPAQLAATIGKTLSEVERDPELAKQALKTFTSIFVPDTALQELDRLVSIQMQHFRDAISVGLAKIGNSGYFDSLSRRLKDATKGLFEFIDSSAFDAYAQRISRAFTRIVDNLGNMVRGFFGNLGGAGGSLGPVETIVSLTTELVEKVSRWSDALPTLGETIGTTVRYALGFVEGIINRIESLLTKAEQVADNLADPGATFDRGVSNYAQKKQSGIERWGTDIGRYFANSKLGEFHNADEPYNRALAVNATFERDFPDGSIPDREGMRDLYHRILRNAQMRFGDDNGGGGFQPVFDNPEFVLKTLASNYVVRRFSPAYQDYYRSAMSRGHGFGSAASPATGGRNTLDEVMGMAYRYRGAGMGSLLPQAQGVVQYFNKLAVSGQRDRTPLDLFNEDIARAYGGNYGTDANPLELAKVLPSIRHRLEERREAVKQAMNDVTGEMSKYTPGSPEHNELLAAYRFLQFQAPSDMQKDYETTVQAVKGNVIKGTSAANYGLLKVVSGASPDLFESMRTQALSGTTPWSTAAQSFLDLPTNPFGLSKIADPMERIDFLQGAIDAGQSFADIRGRRQNQSSLQMSQAKISDLLDKRVAGMSLLDMLQNETIRAQKDYNAAWEKGDWKEIFHSTMVLSIAQGKLADAQSLVETEYRTQADKMRELNGEVAGMSAAMADAVIMLRGGGSSLTLGSRLELMAGQSERGRVDVENAGKYGFLTPGMSASQIMGGYGRRLDARGQKLALLKFYQGQTGGLTTGLNDAQAAYDPGNPESIKNLDRAQHLLAENSYQIGTLKYELNDALQNLESFSMAVRDALQQGIGDGIYDLITGVGSLEDAFQSFAQSVVRSFSDMIAKNLVQSLLGDMFTGQNQNTGNAGILGSIIGAIGSGLTGGLIGGKSAPQGNPWHLEGAANGGVFGGGIRFFRHGGRVRGGRPLLGMVGEGRYDEAIIPMPNGHIPLAFGPGGLMAQLPGGRGIPASIGAASVGGAGGSGIRSPMGMTMGAPSAPVVEVHEGDTYIVSSPEEAFLQGFRKHQDKMINATTRNINKGGKIARVIRRPMF